MNEINLARPNVPYDHGPEDHEPSEKIMAIANDIFVRFANGEKLYFQFNFGERKGSIAYLKKLDTDCLRIKKKIIKGWKGPRIDYQIQMKGTVAWDDRKNTAKVDFFVNGAMSFLDGYSGESVWLKTDVKAEAAKIKAESKIYDMRGREIKEDDVVVFINSRYGSGSCLDYGIVQEIKVKVTHNTYYKRKETEITAIIKNVRMDSDGRDILSKVKNPESYVLVVTGTDLEADVVAARLEAS